MNLHKFQGKKGMLIHNSDYNYQQIQLDIFEDID